MNLAILNRIAWYKLALLFAMSGLAILFGLIAVTANPIFIGLAVGLVVGLFLLMTPKKAVWIVIAFGLATPALLDLAGHGASKILWAISMVALLLWVPSILRLFELNPDKNSVNKKNLPLFIWVAILLVVYATVSSMSHMHGVGELFGGFKRYFQTFGLMLALSTLALSRKDIDKWLNLLLVIALLQLPFALFERFILVPLRGGLASGGEATDIVAGTMGANLAGGSPNAIMVTLILIAFAFVFSRWKAGLINTSRILWLGIVLLLPLILGETKVVVIMIPLMGLVLLRKDIVKNPTKYLPILAILLIFTIALAYIYVYILLDSNFTDAFLVTVQYNLRDVGYGTSILNRTTAMSFWWKLHGWHDPTALLFGHGLGSSYGDGFDAGHIAKNYPNYGINLTTISTLLWDLGLVGLILYISIFILTWFQLSKIWKLTESVQVKADCMSLQVGIAATLLFLIYSDSQVNLLVHEIIVAAMLGYSAFLYQEQREKPNVQYTNLQTT